MASTAVNHDQESDGVSTQTLADDNARFQNTGGISAENHHAGFSPAYRDNGSGVVVRSKFADGQPAPIHVLDGIPDDWVIRRGIDGAILQLKQTVEAGFLRCGDFFTRKQAADLCAAANVDDIHSVSN